MYSHKHCPECDTQATEVMYTEYHANTVERVRQCLDCSVQYVVEYGRPEVVDVTHQE